MWIRRTPALFAVLVVAACGGSPPPAPPATSPAVSPAVSPAAPSSAPPSPSPSPAQAVTAADGTRLAACADGKCEVAVARPARIKLRTGTLQVTRVRARDKVDFKITLRGGGSGSGTLAGLCGSNSFFSAYGVRAETCGDESAAPPPPKPERGEVALQLKGWTTGGAAVIRVVTR